MRHNDPAKIFARHISRDTKTHSKLSAYLLNTFCTILRMSDIDHDRAKAPGARGPPPPSTPHPSHPPRNRPNPTNPKSVASCCDISSCWDWQCAQVRTGHTWVCEQEGARWVAIGSRSAGTRVTTITGHRTKGRFDGCDGSVAICRDISNWAFQEAAHQVNTVNWDPIALH